MPFHVTLDARLSTHLVSFAGTFDSSRSRPSSSPYPESFGQAYADICLFGPQELPRCSWHVTSLHESARACTGLCKVSGVVPTLRSALYLISFDQRFSRIFLMARHVLCLVVGKNV